MVLGTLTVGHLADQQALIREAMGAVMRPDVDYGVIPGTGSKPTLLKPGAEKLCFLFRLAAEYEIVRSVETATEITFLIRCTLRHIGTGAKVGEGLGSCSSRDRKYGTRRAQRKCPQCQQATIFESKHNPEFYCWQKKGGCGAKFAITDPVIVDQPIGEIPNPDIWDLYNTILKMACKRAHVHAVLGVTAASDFFTQDIEDSEHVTTPGGTTYDKRTGEVRGFTGKAPANDNAPPASSVTPAQARRYDSLRAELSITEEAGIERTGKYIGRPITSIDDLTAREMDRVLAKMEELAAAPPSYDNDESEVPIT